MTIQRKTIEKLRLPCATIAAAALTCQVGSAQLTGRGGGTTEYHSGIPGTWSRTVGGSAQDTCFKAVHAFDNSGVLLVGDSASFPGGTSWVVKLTPSGDLDWQSTYSGVTGDSGDYDGNGWVLGGRNTNSSLELQATRLDPAGEVLWSKTFRSPLSSYFYSSPGFAHTLAAYDGGAFVASNEWNQVGYYSFSSDITVYRLDQAGNLLWNRILSVDFGDPYDPYGNPGSHESLAGIDRAFDGGLFLLGESAYEPLVVRLDQAGNQVWARLLRTGGTSRALRATLDGGVLLGGDVSAPSPSGMSSVIWLVRLDQGGNPIWQISLGAPSADADYELRAISPTADGSNVVVGRTRNAPTEDWDTLAAKIGPGGDLEWAYSYGGDAGEAALSVVNTSVFDWVIAGSSDSFGAAGSEEYWAMRVNRDGKIVFDRASGASTEKLDPLVTDESSAIVPLSLPPEPASSTPGAKDAGPIRQSTAASMKKQTRF